MIIAEQHRRGPAKPGDRKKNPNEEGRKVAGEARSANPEQGGKPGGPERRNAPSAPVPGEGRR